MAHLEQGHWDEDESMNDDNDDNEEEEEEVESISGAEVTLKRLSAELQFREA